MSIVDLSRRPIALVVRFGALGAFLVLAMAGCKGTAQSSLTALPPRAADLEVSLGAIDDSVLAFSTISGLTVDRDGRMYVLQSTEPIVTVLNPNGTLHQRFGRRGQGPGEFSAAGWVGWWGGTLWVTDMFQQRVSLFYRGQLCARAGSRQCIRDGAECLARMSLRSGRWRTVPVSRFCRGGSNGRPGPRRTISRSFERPTPERKRSWPGCRSPSRCRSSSRDRTVDHRRTALLCSATFPCNPSANSASVSQSSIDRSPAAAGCDPPYGTQGLG